jgi:excisionase family DNA binding protein
MMMIMRNKYRKPKHCQRCGHEWTPKTDKPLSCPACKRYDWQESKELTIEEKLEKTLLAITKLLTAKDVAEMLNVNVQRVYELVRVGVLPVLLLGQRQIRFDEEILKRWIEESINKKGVAK